MEEDQPEQEEQQDQEQQEEQQPPAAGGGPGGDPDDDDDDEGDDDEGDGDEDGDEDEQQQERPPGWIIDEFTRDGGDDYYHDRLIRMLHRHYGMGYVGVEYHCEQWTHDRFPDFWRVTVQVRVPDHGARAARRRTRHSALSDRETLEAGISDAARQAYYRYRQELWEEIQDRPERYHPRRESGATACTIASTAGIVNRQFASTVALVAVLNTDLDAVSEENFLLRARNTALQDRVEQLESLVAGTAAPRSPEYRAESPPRKRTCYGTAEARTTVEDPEDP
ncbi:unnamed protein product [Urochloa humidicola]